MIPKLQTYKSISIFIISFKNNKKIKKKFKNMKDKLLQLLEIQDSSKIPFHFLFNGKRNIHFTFGIILSLLMNIISFLFSITLILELLHHSKPSVNYAQFQSSMTTNMTLNTKQLLFTIAFRDKDYKLINDPTIASLNAFYERTTTFNGVINIEELQLDFMNCSNVYPLFKEFGVSDNFDNVGLINYNCYNYTEPIIIGGKYGTEFYANLAFYISKCRNSSDSNITCKSEEDIDDLLEKGWLQITYVSSYVDFNNYSHPIQYVTEDTYIMFDVKMNKKMYVFFSPLQIFSENNILFSNEKKETSTKHDITTTDIISVLDNGIISSIMVCPSFTVDKYYRRYIKIQEIGASIGGLYSGLSIISFLLTAFYKLRYVEMKIINELFFFGSEHLLNDKKSLFKFLPNLKFENNNNNTDDKKEMILNNRLISLKGINNNNVIDVKIPDKIKRNSLNFANNKFNKFFYYKIDLGLKNSLKMIFCVFKNEIKENYKEYIFVKKELLKYIDYSQVTKYFMDVEKIKSLLNKYNLSEKWVSEKKLIAIDIPNNNNNNNHVSKMIHSTILANSNFVFNNDM